MDEVNRAEVKTGLVITGISGFMLGLSYLVQEGILAKEPTRKFHQRLYGLMTGSASIVAGGAMFLFARSMKNRQ